MKLPVERWPGFPIEGTVDLVHDAAGSMDTGPFAATAVDACLNTPYGLAFDSDENLFISENVRGPVPLRSPMPMASQA